MMGSRGLRGWRGRFLDSLREKGLAIVVAVGTLEVSRQFLGRIGFQLLSAS
ncbi:MAG: hypothetical protein HN909_07560 [Phycisphaerales bacterium]|jgi:hypothetical protein|nr:hypothetical protein [Phycisphaerales bacterium]MBT7171610.1 hypothetical protein [Phycisphaerales bacterium]